MDLPDNNISDQGCVDLANAIAHNPSLTQLQLAYNKISDRGAAALAEVSPRCPSPRVRDNLPAVFRSSSL